VESHEHKLARVLAEEVVLVPWDPRWPERFRAEAAHLRGCLPPELLGRMEHFGSTAVPGLDAKPIVDVLVEVTDLAAVRERVVPLLEAQGYDFFWRPTEGDDGPPFYAWFIKRDSATGARTHHIHMMEPGFHALRDGLRFRDLLLAQPELAGSYAALKHRLAADFAHDCVAYTHGKGEFIRRALDAGTAAPAPPAASAAAAPPAAPATPAAPAAPALPLLAGSPGTVALLVSCGVILGSWAQVVVRQVVGVHAPASVQELALRVAVQSAITIVLIWLLLRTTRESFADLGLETRGLGGVLGRAILPTLGLFVLANVVLNSVLAAVMHGEAVSPIRGLFRDPREAPYWVFAALVGGGFTEELKRTFVLTRFEKAFGRTGLVMALVVDTAVFGLGHLYQGRAGAISAGFTGLVFALIFLRRRRVVDAMAVHAGFDLLGVAAGYALYATRD
jgi:GrpB-like predicted nucleotidyltransferase (UPF0157 family)/membrane protease YdiL (CAAX protease family)